MSTTAADHAIPTGHLERSIPSTRASASPSATAASARSAAPSTDFDAKLVDGRLEGVAKVASVNVDDENLAGHLQSPDFFDAEQHPELRFVSNTIERDGDRVSIEGELTLRGVTHPVEITGTVTGPLENAYGQQRIGFDLETTVNRHDYGITWNMELPGGGQALGDDVVITANLALVQA